MAEAEAIRASRVAEIRERHERGLALGQNSADIDFLLSRIEELEKENAANREVWRVLRDQSVIVDQDGEVFGKIAEWLAAPSNTASADLEHGAALGGEE